MSDREAECVETAIDALAAGGDGVGRLPDGRALFVPLTVPGDRIRVRVLERKKRFARGVLEEVLTPSEDRVAPRCPVFGTCGGCTWQHVAYRAQLAAKAEIVRDALVRLGHFDVSAAVPMTAAPEPYGYRSRTRLLRSGTAVGYRMRRSHRVCGVDRCPVLNAPLERALGRLAAAAKPGGSGPPVEWELAAGADGTTRANRPGLRGSPRGSVVMRAGSDRLRISAGVFAQGNEQLLEPLLAAVTREAGEGSSVVELFAGAGLFTIELSRRFDCVFALESNERAVADLRFNLGAAARTNVEIHAGRVEKTLASLGVRVPDAVVLDPPRTGVSREALAALAALRPRRIVYLSCDPATLARDMARLRTAGFTLLRVEGFDLFPQTPHVEALATLAAETGRAQGSMSPWRSA